MQNMDDYLSTEVDWWAVACARPGVWYYLDSGRQWNTFSGDLLLCRPVHQGGIFHFGSTTILDAYLLESGTYDFWFAVNFPMDGILDVNGPLLFNKVTVVAD